MPCARGMPRHLFFKHRGLGTTFGARRRGSMIASRFGSRRANSSVMWAVYRSSGPSSAAGYSPDSSRTRVASSVNWAAPRVKRNSPCRRNQWKSTLANRFAERIEARWFATVRSVSRSSAISGSTSAHLALYFSREPRVISPRLSRASKDGCSTEKDVHLSIDP